MGAIHQALLSIAPPASGGVGIPFITAVTIVGTRNNFDGGVGFRFTVGASAMIVTDLGRQRFSGNANSHTVQIWRNSDLVLMASASVDMSTGTVGEFNYTAITPVTLAAGVTYNVASVEVNGGDTWGDDNMTGISSEPDGTITHSIFQVGVGAFQNNAAGVRSYVPPNFKFHL